MITITRAIQGFRSAGDEGERQDGEEDLFKGRLGFRVSGLKKEDNRVQKRRVQNRKKVRMR